MGKDDSNIEMEKRWEKIIGQQERELKVRLTQDLENPDTNGDINELFIARHSHYRARCFPFIAIFVMLSFAN